MTESDRITEGLRTLVHEISADRREFRNAIGDNSADQLLEGLVARGYAMRKGDRFAVSPAGFRRLEAVSG